MNALGFASQHASVAASSVAACADAGHLTISEVQMSSIMSALTDSDDPDDPDGMGDGRGSLSMTRINPLLSPR